MKNNKSPLSLIVICLLFIISIVILAPKSLNFEVFAAACPPGQICLSKVTVDVFICNYNPGPPRSCYTTLVFPPPGSEDFGCDEIGSDCSTSYHLCSSNDSCRFTDGYGSSCSWWGSGCTGPYCSVCSDSGCCAAAGPTPAPDPTPTPLPDPTPPPTPSCTVDLSPATASIAVGSDITYFSTVTIGSGTVDQVNFSSSNTSVATVNPASDASSPYQTIATGASVGSSTMTSDVVMSGAVRCTDTASLDVTTPDPWWQVIDADIIANGNIISSIPLSCALPDCDPVLGLEGLGGFPGVPSYLGSASFGEGSVSSKGWLAESETKFKKVYDYDFFDRLVRTDVTITEISEPEVNGGFFTSGGTPSRGYVWYHFDGSSVPPGDLTINSSINMPGDRKVVVLIEDADLYIDGRINIVDGNGFFMVIVGKNDGGNKGNIYIKDDLPGQDEIEGVFLAEGQFKTGAGDNQLYVRGMVAAYDGVVLERDLTDNSTEPAELFEYAPDMVLTFPRDLTYKRLRWKEVAP